MAEIASLIPLLLAKSAEGKIDWQEAGEGVFAANMGIYDIVIAPSTGSFGRGYRVSLVNSSGRTVESFGSDTPFDNTHEVLSEIYSIAHRKAMKVDEAITDVQKKLQSL